MAVESERSDVSFRFDCTIEIVAEDKETGVVTLRFKPDPKRYEWVERNGDRLLFDRYDSNLFTTHALEQLFTLSAPMYVQRPKIANAEDYIAERVATIGAALDGEDPVETYLDQPSDVLRSLPSDWEYAFLVADVVGSTHLSFALNRNDFARVMRIVLAEMSAMVPLFNGHVLKHTGDGLIAFFPAPSFVRMNDMALDCALSLNGLIELGVNPALEARSLPSVKVRIGIESGYAIGGPVGDPASKQIADLLGREVNVAAKLQSAAEPGQILVGPIAERNLHIRWREMLESVAVPATLPGIDGVFRFAGSKASPRVTR